MTDPDTPEPSPNPFAVLLSGYRNVERRASRFPIATGIATAVALSSASILWSFVWAHGDDIGRMLFSLINLSYGAALWTYIASAKSTTRFDDFALSNGVVFTLVLVVITILSADTMVELNARENDRRLAAQIQLLASASGQSIPPELSLIAGPPTSDERFYANFDFLVALAGAVLVSTATYFLFRRHVWVDFERLKEIAEAGSETTERLSRENLQNEEVLMETLARLSHVEDRLESLDGRTD